MVRANTKQSGTGEFEIQFAILELMKDQKIWSNAELKYKLKASFSWTPEDLQTAKNRNEYRWENRINNALSPSRKSSLYGQHYVENHARGEHRITPLGLKFITNGFEDQELLQSIIETVTEKP